VAWSDCRIYEKLERELTRSEALRVYNTNGAKEARPAFPENRYDLDSLMNWGLEIGERYLMVVDIRRESLETQKSFNIPLIFHKYETVGVIEGDIRFIDLQRGKLMLAEPFKVELKGPRIFQGSMDDNANDADIHLTAPEKLVFIDRLESHLAKELVNRVNNFIGSK
ncbi:MAG: hypothetical protein ACOYVF_06685, partial [Candidatus Zixiibacteriota bacterium]